MLGFLLISFAAGVLTVLAPCILPLLPVIVGGSVTGKPSARRALVIVASLGVSVLLFTLLLKATTAFIEIPALFWQLFSGGLLLLFGIVTLWPSLWDRIPFVSSLYRSSNKLAGFGHLKGTVWGDVIVGAALGPVFSSCSPTYFVILAAVLPASLSTGVLYLLAYVLGLCLFLFVIAFLGGRALSLLGVVSAPGSWFRRIVGILFIIVGIAIIFGLDKKLEAALPAGAFGEASIEQQLLSLDPSAAENVSGTSSPSADLPNVPSTGGGFLTATEKAVRYPKAPELTDIAGYINTGGQPITLSQYRGKDVVLVDFWDYSCINCQRTIPYLNAWYEKYKGQGFVVIGVHTPEFAFEQLEANVAAAVTRADIQYPVVLDNQYKTWDAFQNEYWPREYLIDIDGYIVYNHAGEGDYDVSEKAIQAALAERAVRLGTGAVATSTVNIQPDDLTAIESPETYFGAARNQYLGNGTQGRAGTQTLTLPSAPTSVNTLYLGGVWNFMQEYAEASTGATVLYEYDAHDVYMVAANNGAPATVEVLLDGKPVGANAGADVDPATSDVTIQGDRLYTLVHETTPGAHLLELKVVGGTLDAYTFTFG